MKKIILYTVCLCICSIILFQCQQSPKTGLDKGADEMAVRKQDSAWAVATDSKQINDFMKYVADNGIVQAPNAPKAEGKEAVEKLMSSFFALPGFSVTWQAAKIEVANGGDMAYSLGAYSLVINDPKGQAVNDHGKYLTIWKKQTDGTWKVAVDMFNSDLPNP